MDESGDYYESSKTIYDFSSDQSVTIEMESVGPEGGIISITAIDVDTQIELPDTTVTLYDSDGIVEERKTNSDGEVEFNVRDKDALYDAVIDNELYLVKRATDLSAGSTYTIELIKYTVKILRA